MVKSVSQRQQGQWIKWEDILVRPIGWSDLWKNPPAKLNFLIRAMYDSLSSPVSTQGGSALKKIVACAEYSGESPPQPGRLQGCPCSGSVQMAVRPGPQKAGRTLRDHERSSSKQEAPVPSDEACPIHNS